MDNEQYPMECSMSIAIEYINSFRLDIYRNLRAEQKHLYINQTKKNFIFYNYKNYIFL